MIGACACWCHFEIYCSPLWTAQPAHIRMYVCTVTLYASEVGLHDHLHSLNVQLCVYVQM